MNTKAVVSFVLLIIANGFWKESRGHAMYRDEKEAITSLFAEFLQSLEDENGERRLSPERRQNKPKTKHYFQDRERVEDKLSIFSRDRRSRSLRCNFHSLCYCRSKITGRGFCCDCAMGPCFPSTSTVYTPEGEIYMKDLRIGHEILTVTEGGQKTYSKVVAFLDRRPAGQAEYLVIEAENGKSIQISANHLMFTSLDNNTNDEIRFAGNIEIGSYVTVVEDNSSTVKHIPVTNITRKLLDGAYVPLTEHGTLLVDGILASCYASYDHNWAHFFLTPVRWFPRLFTHDIPQPVGIMPYVHVLKSLASFLLPQSLKSNHYRNSEVDVFKEDLQYGKSFTFLLFE